MSYNEGLGRCRYTPIARDLSWLFLLQGGQQKPTNIYPTHDRGQERIGHVILRVSTAHTEAAQVVVV